MTEARAKLWKHESKSGSDAKEMLEHGISIVKLKKNADGKVRLLGRSDANGRVQMVRETQSSRIQKADRLCQNFSLFPKLKINAEKAFLTFMGFEGTEPMMFRLRLRNADLANQLKAAIEAETAKLS